MHEESNASARFMLDSLQHTVGQLANTAVVERRREEEVKGGERQLVTAHCSQVPQLHKQIGFTTGNTSGLGNLAARYRQTQDPDSITVSPFTHNESETSRLV